MKLIGLKIAGVRLIEAIQMQFTNNGLIPIKGPNRNGKTTILDSIEALIKGRSTFTTDMIKHGADKAIIEGQIGDEKETYTVKRVIRPGGRATLKITNSEGFKLTQKPETFLKNMVNDLTFDPRPFLRKKDEEKLQFMLDLMKVNFKEEDTKIKELTEERKLVGREVKRMGDIEVVAETKMVDMAELVSKKAEKERQNAEIRAFNEAARREAEEHQRKRDQYMARLEDLKRQKAEIEAAIQKGEAMIIEHGEPRQPKFKLEIPTSDLDEQLAQAAVNNERASQYKAYLEKKTAKEEKEQEYAKLSASINDLRLAKRRKLGEVEIPVPGLEIVIQDDEREDGLYHNGIHCSNWSESEGMRIAADLWLKLNSSLRAIFIDRGEAYDSKSLQALDEWARENDLQAIITIVDDIPDECADGVFYIEEGALVGSE
jgi:uncharacterized protein YlxW (UPF0749 family)